MERKFEDGAMVRMDDDIIRMAPAYADKFFTIKAATASWGIGQKNEWYGEYLIEDELGNVSVTSQSCLVAAQG